MFVNSRAGNNAGVLCNYFIDRSRTTVYCMTISGTPLIATKRQPNWERRLHS